MYVPESDCKYTVYGCTNPTATNYNSHANTWDNSCVYPVYGCMDSMACNFDYLSNEVCPANIATLDPSAACPCGYMGCEDDTAFNYNSHANLMTLYQSNAFKFPSEGIGGPQMQRVCMDNQCFYQTKGCKDSRASNYNGGADLHMASWCNYMGCMDTDGLDYDPTATIAEDCAYPVPGCMDSRATTYVDTATVHTANECFFEGCMDSLNPAYDPIANIPMDWLCPRYELGCMDNTADTYSATEIGRASCRERV